MLREITVDVAAWRVDSHVGQASGEACATGEGARSLLIEVTVHELRSS